MATINLQGIPTQILLGESTRMAALSANAAATSAAAAASSATAASDAVASVQPSIATLFTRGGYIRYSDGVFVTDATWGTTPLLEVAQIDIKQIKLQGATTAANVAFFDANRGYISGVAAASTGAYVTAYPAVPGNAVYVTFTDKVSDRANEIFRYTIKPLALAAQAPATSDQQSLITKLFSRAGYVNTTGVYVADATWASTPLIELAYLDVSRIKLYGHTSVTTIAFYDADRAFISGTVAGTIGTPVTTMPATPGGAFYFSFTTYVSDIANNLFVPVNKAATNPWRSDFAVSLDVATLMTTAGYINTSGNLVLDANWLCTDFLTITAGEKVGFTVYGNAAVRSIAFYDANKAYISGLTQAGTYVATATAPAGAAYYRLTTGKPGTGSVSAGFVYAATYKMRVDNFLRTQLVPSAAASTFSVPVFKRPRANKLTGSSKVALYGDSRSSTDYAFIATNYATLTGATCVSQGISGSTLATELSPTNLSALAATNPDVIVFLPGGNDTGASGTVGTLSGAVPGETTVSPITYAGGAYTGTYFVQGIDYFCQWFKATYYDIRTRAGLTGSETETQKNDAIRAVRKPMLIICTDLPQKRNSSGDAFSQTANWTRKRQAIIEACARNKIHCVDTMDVVGWDMSLEPYWTSPTAIVNNGVWTMDGLHPNEFGHMDMARIVCADAGLV